MEEKYLVALVSVIKDDNIYLNEWIKHHIDIGVEEILVYDNNSKVPLVETAQSLPKEYLDRVIFKHLPCEELPQNNAYRQAASYYSDKSYWVLLLDVDEFLRLEDGWTLKSVAEFFKTNPNISTVLLAWRNFNAGGQEHYRDAPVQERFTEYVDWQDINHGKTMVRPGCITFVGVHNHYVVGFNTVQTDLLHHEPGTEIAACYQKIWVDHYFTKSYEEWLWKLNRGTCDERYVRKYKEFFAYNPDMQDCYEEKYEKLVEGGLN